MASLALYSETHPAAPVSAVLGLVPTKTHELGDAKLHRKTGKVITHFRQSAWLLDVARPPTRDDDDGFTALRALLDQLGDIGDALATLRPHYRTAIRWSGTVSIQGNFTMEASLIAALARLGCELYGTAYYDDEGEEEQASGPDTGSLQV